MKHGIYYAYWEHEWEADYPFYVEKVARLGFDYLEINAGPLPDYTPNQIHTLKKSVEDNGIFLTASYGPTAEQNIGSSDAAVRKSALEWYKRLFDVMAQLDIRQIGGELYTYWPIEFHKVNKEEDWKNSVEGMKMLSPLARQYGITMGMEILNRFEGYLLNTAKEGVAFVKEVGEDNVKVMLDTFHMNIEEDSFGEAIRTAGSLLGHLHTGECNRKLPGKGRIPWREIKEALRDIQYDGTVTMEPFVLMGGSIAQDIKVWRDISNGASTEQLDQDAKNALAFQRYLLHN